MMTLGRHPYVSLQIHVACFTYTGESPSSHDVRHRGDCALLGHVACVHGIDGNLPVQRLSVICTDLVLLAASYALARCAVSLHPSHHLVCFIGV